MIFEYFGTDSHVSTYNKFRPSPPESLREEIVQFTLEKIPQPLGLAVDVGCGSGQSTELLAPYFKKILGLDSSEEIIKEAMKKCQHPNVFYGISPAEKMNLENETVDLMTVGQSLHWFDIPKFYSEAERILRPKGVLAVYGYNLPVPVINDNKKISSLITKYYKDILGEYTLPQSRKVYLENYTSDEFNDVYFIEGRKMKRKENFMLETEGKIDDIMGYIRSWSAFQNYTRQKGEENGNKILKEFEEEFKNALGPEEKSVEKFTIRFNYFLLLGRKE